MTVGKWDSKGILGFSSGDTLNAAELNTTFQATNPPIGSIIGWLKTFDSQESGSSTTTTTGKLIDSTATFNVVLDHTAIKGSSVNIEIEVFEMGASAKIVGRIRETWQLHPGINNQSWTVNILDAKHWSPDNPQLYKAKIKVINNGEVSDQWSENFGMRRLTIKAKDFYLNGERIYISRLRFLRDCIQMGLPTRIQKRWPEGKFSWPKKPDLT